MKTNTLRIGNYIKSGKGFYKIVAISTNGVEVVTEIDNDLMINNNSIVFSGIPLSKEWVESLGFKKDKHNWYGKELDKFNSMMINIAKGDLLIMERQGTNVISLTSIKYIHELQNIYTDITGKELNKQI